MRSALLAIAVVASLAIGGCSDQPEIDRPGTWKPTGLNDRNLRAMIADPQDLYAGESAPTTRGNGASRAVTRLLTDRRRQLLNVSLSRIAPAQDATDTPLGGATGGGAGGGAGAAP